MADTTRVRFTFATEASPSDPKTTVHLVKRLQLEEDEECFAFPSNLENLSLHTDLLTLSTVKNVKKSLTQRNMVIKTWVELSKELKKKYLDDQGNPVFEGTMLTTSVPYVSQKMIVTKAAPPVEESKPLANILKNAVIEKFGSKPVDAATWLDQFENECTRLEIPETRYWEAIRLFLENTATDWYQTTLSSSKSAPWETWRSSFLDAFAQKGWASARDAFLFRYQSGSLADFALKKLNLLVTFNSKMDELTKIAHIVIGLPYAVQEKIDRSEIESVSKLLSKLNSFERQIRFSSSPREPRPRNVNAASRQPAHRVSNPCQYCINKGFAGTSHEEIDCRTKKADKFRQGNEGHHSSYPKTKPTPTKPEGNLVSLADVRNILSEIESYSKNE